jgi:hypothetical protein
MSTIDTSSWKPDADLNVEIEGIPLNADAGIAQTWRAVAILMAAMKGDVNAVKAMISVMDGSTASADGASGLVPKPLAGDQDKVLKGDGTWGSVTASSVAWSDVTGKPSSFTPSSHAHGNLTNEGRLGASDAPSRAVVTTSDRKIAVSSTTATEVGYLSGLSANAQNQLDARLLASEKITNSDIEAMMEA